MLTFNFIVWVLFATAFLLSFFVADLQAILAFRQLLNQSWISVSHLNCFGRNLVKLENTVRKRLRMTAIQNSLTALYMRWKMLSFQNIPAALNAAHLHEPETASSTYGKGHMFMILSIWVPPRIKFHVALYLTCRTHLYNLYHCKLSMKMRALNRVMSLVVRTFCLVEPLSLAFSLHSFENVFFSKTEVQIYTSIYRSNDNLESLGEKHFRAENVFESPFWFRDPKRNAVYRKLMLLWPWNNRVGIIGRKIFRKKITAH